MRLRVEDDLVEGYPAVIVPEQEVEVLEGLRQEVADTPKTSDQWGGRRAIRLSPGHLVQPIGVQVVQRVDVPHARVAHGAP